MRTRKLAPKGKPHRGVLMYGDQNEGARFDRMLKRKFGTQFGSRRDAITTLDISRRLMNMYITGERAIPDTIWIALKALPDFDGEKQSAAAYRDFVKHQPPEGIAKGRRAIPAVLYIDDTDDIDPLS